ncbi:Rfx1 DNA binding protein [Candida orthopsilosis Co 90-125]|uniref:Rfx1 DNA binding protein n=1 Tax=Candida orthopsilosis (strain 90-125) TaxID=1136231 RepID=H8X6A2_CANO9|nr:Rfx1 DNA binding protein [Candida orthopsilosis Co 90-125]CCG23350.1 Rfx1 DNA binding protein [Candida orthopsilosis Co 90-125]
MNPERYSSHQRSAQLPQQRQEKQQQQTRHQQQQHQYQHASLQQGASHDFSTSDQEPQLQHQQYSQPTTFASLQIQPEYLQEQVSEQSYTQPINPTYIQPQRISSSQPLGQQQQYYSQPAYLTQESINLSMPQSHQYTNYRATGQYSNTAFAKPTSDQTNLGASLQTRPSQRQPLQRMQQGEPIQQPVQISELQARYEPVPSSSSSINPTSESYRHNQYGQATTASSPYTSQSKSQLQQDLQQEDVAKGPPPAHLRRHRRNNSSISSVLHSTAYEEELKNIALSKINIPLPEIARRIKQSEFDNSNTPSSSRLAPQEGSFVLPASSPSSAPEKTQTTKEAQRSVFGMVWLLTSCEVSPTAVIPRNRIYARYVQICADNSLSPLSPASFGKLVRILYPTITTRRLGMRGQSKYHYCGIRLKGEQSMQSQLIQKQQQQRSQPRGHSLGSEFTMPSQWQSHLQSPTRPGISSTSVAQSPLSTNSSMSHEESPRSTFATNTPIYSPINSPSVFVSSSISDQLPSTSHMKYIPDLFKLLGMESVATKSYPYTPIDLPPIYSYLPKDTDRDIADTLSSLYKVHINTVFESLRFMQLKRLFSSFNNFNSILSTPVSKLYTADSVLEWVKECDLIMYKKMIRMLSKLHMQYMMPQDNINQLKTIAFNYTRTLGNSIINSRNSKNFIAMKLKMAKHFVNLLNRLIKVIETGSTASRILNDDNEKQSMLNDWQKLNFTDLVSRDVLCADESNVNMLIFISTEEVVKLLETPSVEEDSPMQVYADFISDLPSRFPRTNARMFLLLSSNLLTSILREISLNSGEGFGAWWIVRCWVDEYLAWTMEVGGFFQDELIAYLKEGQAAQQGEETMELQKQEEMYQSQPVGDAGSQEQEYNLSAETSIDLLG